MGVREEEEKASSGMGKPTNTGGPFLTGQTSCLVMTYCGIPTTIWGAGSVQKSDSKNTKLGFFQEYVQGNACNGYFIGRPKKTSRHSSKG